MNRAALWMAVPTLALAVVASAASKKHDPTTITCEEFASHTPEGQLRMTAFLDGYSKRGKKVEEVGEVDVQRELDVLVVACRQDPKVTLWDKFKTHLPGGKKRVKPVEMTCEEYLSLEKDVQPEVAYWVEGYDRKTKTEVEAAGEVDLERDVAVLIEMCRPTPKASFWKRLHEKL